MHWLLLLAAQNPVDISDLPTSRVDIIKTGIQITIGIVAAICLLFITIGGLRYVLSQGDPQAIAKAKGTVLYALIGHLVVIVAQAIVTFVIGGVK
jgi:hypothetical protein